MNSIFDSREFNDNLFFPRRDRGKGIKDSEDLFVEVESPIKVHVRRYRSPHARFSMLYFHGNGEIVADYDDLAPFYNALGAELVVADYRGYGQSDGMPTLRAVLKDAHVVYQHLADRKILKTKRCVMGRSLGSAPAIELCIHYPEIGCLIIESGYADPIPLVERRGLKIQSISPEDNALFSNSHKIAAVKCPLFIMHGEDDFLISAEEANLNFQKAGSKPKVLDILEGVGHNDMMMAPNGAYFSGLKKFLDSIF
ncbi:MAG: alpha/beta hydrolase [Nitrospinae bacterium CG11_big_fil_rev_8_21_14_0_20_56_8]|nr:MAG: alpha/beta hydrolase [Nitrospinae bacterium CG11_big_fil_rev_8_21_14_0_20_56_8]